MISLRERLARAMRIDTHTLPYRWSSNDPATRTPTFKLPDPEHSWADFGVMLEWASGEIGMNSGALIVVGVCVHKMLPCDKATWADFRRDVTERMLQVIGEEAALDDETEARDDERSALYDD